MNYEIVTANIRAELKTYLETSGLKSIVLGISGGIDSTLCAALARPVCDELGVELIGRSITIETNSQDEIDRGRLAGKVFCTNFEEIDLTDEYNFMKTGINSREGWLENYTADKIREGNIKARMRMIYLYNISQLKGGMVLSTDNFTELMVGFWSLHGDVGDYGMVQNLYKMEVYGLSKWLAVNVDNDDAYKAIMDCVDATPTDGLGITSSDVEQLGAENYMEVDNILREHFIDNTKHTDHPVIKRHYASEFKRNNPYNLPRDVVVNGAE